MREHLVIAGGGQAATQAAQSVRQRGFDGRISLIAAEDSLPYQRPPLSKKFLAGEVERERLYLKPSEFYQTREIELMLGRRVMAFDPAKRRLALDDDARLDYTQLLLATGARPRRLELPGVDLAGVHYLRSIADVDAIHEDFRPGQRLLIVGAGYIGLEVAAVAVGAGLEVTVLEVGERVMARSVSAATAEFFADRHRQAGVDLRLATELRALRGNGRVRAAETGSGERIDCDLVIVAAGIEPVTGIADRAGLMVDDGIVVDADARTAAAAVFAAGDCASYPHPWLGRRLRLESVQNAIEQGKAAAAAICGHSQAFTAVPWFWSDQYELKLQLAGLALAYDQTVTRGKPDDGSFSVFYLDSGSVIAVDCVNDPRTFMAARKHLPGKPRWQAAAIADPATDLAALGAADHGSARSSSSSS